MNKILIPLVLFMFASACTTTHVSKIVGDSKFEASNTSIGWDRENITLGLTKPDNTTVKIEIGSSGGSAGLDRAITGFETALKQLKSMRP